MKTVAVLLGPNRNLTTLFSAMLALHPQTAVLNHAFVRIFGDEAVDFIARPAPEVLAHFVDVAQTMTINGQRGAIGGHILHSHAFGDRRLREAYEARYGSTGVYKTGATCLVWKDAIRVTGHIRTHRAQLETIAAALPPLRFIMPVRNPVDCMISNIEKGYSSVFMDGTQVTDRTAVFTTIVRMHAWFYQAYAGNERQFFYIFQDNFTTRETLSCLARFLEIDDHDDWASMTNNLINIRNSYVISARERNAYLAILTKELDQAPILRKRITELIMQSAL